MTSPGTSTGLRSVSGLAWPSSVALAHPRTTGAACLLLFVLFGLGIARLELESDGAALVPPDAPEVLLEREVARRFDLRDPIAVVLESSEDADEGIWRVERLAHVAQLSAALTDLPGVGPQHVASLASESSDRVLPGSLDFRPWLTPLPSDSAACLALRDDMLEVGIYRGTLLSADAGARATSILVGVPEVGDRRSFLRSLRAVLERTRAGREHAGLTVHLAGAPVAEASLGDHLATDLARLIPASVLLLALAFLLAFRNPVAALLPLLEVGFALVATFGALGWLGIPIYLSMAVLPVVLCAVGVADEFHVYGAWLRERRSQPGASPRERALRTMQAMAHPVSATSVTTALGFLAFVASPLAAVRAFGLAMALGIALCLGWTLCIMPVLLQAFDARLARGQAGERLGRVGSRLARRSAASIARPLPILVATFAALVLLPFGVARITVQDSWVGGFAPDSEVARSIERVNELFGGAHLLRVVVEAEDPRAAGQVPRSAISAQEVVLPARLGSSPAALVGCELTLRSAGSDDRQLRTTVARATWDADSTRLALTPAGPDPARWLDRATAIEWHLTARERLLTPACIDLLADLERYLESFDPEDVARVVGPFEHLVTMNFMLRNRAPGSRIAPESKERARAVLVHYVNVRGQRALERLFQDEASAALLTAFLPSANYADTAGILSALDAFEDEHLAPHGLSLALAGDVPRSQAMIAAIVRTELSSLAGGLLLVLLAASLFLRSLVLGLLCTLPAGIAVLSTFAFMGVVGIPLGVATSMFAAMTLGIGVDYALHLTSAALRCGQAGAAGAAQAVAETGPVILLDALALGAAFGLLLLSQVPTNARLGALMVVSLFACAVVSLGLLPLLLARHKA